MAKNDVKKTAKDSTVKKSAPKKSLHKTKVDSSGKHLMNGRVSLDGQYDIPTIDKSETKPKKKKTAEKARSSKKAVVKSMPRPRPLLPEEIALKQNGIPVANPYRNFTIQKINSIIEVVTVQALNEEAAISIARDLEAGHWTVSESKSVLKAEGSENSTSTLKQRTKYQIFTHPRWAHVVKFSEELNKLRKLHPSKLNNIIFDYNIYTVNQLQLEEAIFEALGNEVGSALADFIETQMMDTYVKNLTKENVAPFEEAIFNYASYLLNPNIVPKSEAHWLTQPIVPHLYGSEGVALAPSSEEEIETFKASWRL